MTASSPKPARKRVGILISGRGSNMQSLVSASRQDTDAGFDVVKVVSNRPEAAGLTWAAEQGIATEAIDHKAFSSRTDFEDALHGALIDADVEIVACAGFMRILTDTFVEKWRNRMLNIHPSLLPAFRGIDTHERVLAEGVKIAGCTVHIVWPELDAGPILGQAAVSVAPNETPESLAARVIVAEHKLYPEILKRFCRGQIRLNGKLAVYDENINQSDILYSPSI